MTKYRFHPPRVRRQTGVELAMTAHMFAVYDSGYQAGSSGACSRVPLQTMPPRLPISTLP